MLARCCKHLFRRFEPRYINPSSAVKKHNCAGVSIRLLLTSSDGSSKKSESVLPDASVVKPTAGNDDDADMSADEFEPDVKTDISKITSSALGDNDEEFDGDEDNEARRLYYEQKVSGVEAPRAPRIQAAYVPLREKLIDDQGRSYGTGKRKTSIARVWIKEGSGLFIVNDKRLIDYFTSMHREYCLESFMASKTAGLFDVWCTVKGGGTSGQAGAIRLGIARALEAYNPSYRELLAPAGMMTRDSRRVERKKPGQKKARKNFQWVKR